MEIRSVDPRDTVWERDRARYRVSFWDVPAGAAYEYEVVSEVDVDELLVWAARFGAERGWSYTVYAVVAERGRAGLVRLAGVSGDPFAGEGGGNGAVVQTS
ncbi:hypothetical protein ACL02R_19760 [Streptomyces sp. MS19]|uniref:hypothetical protein n=1 Tax=Streptomyces sp. MS19 TaxID=3385972 RepID=UPI0039A30840